jgi:hypothetical protein
MTNPETDLIGSYPDVCKVIRSCTTVDQLETARQYVALYEQQLPAEVVPILHDDLARLIEYQALAIQSHRGRMTNEISMDAHS